MTVEKLCAFVNNNTRFASMFHMKMQAMIACLDPKFHNRICDYNLAIVSTHLDVVNKSLGMLNLYTANRNYCYIYGQLRIHLCNFSCNSIELLLKEVIVEMKNTLKSGLFRDDWDNNASCINYVLNSVDKYYQDFSLWIVRNDYLNLVVIYIIRAVVDYYLELLLTSSLMVHNHPIENCRHRTDSSITFLLLSFR